VEQVSNLLARPFNPATHCAAEGSSIETVVKLGGFLSFTRIE
jgi:hypothetical protein